MTATSRPWTRAAAAAAAAGAAPPLLVQLQSPGSNPTTHSLSLVRARAPWGRLPARTPIFTLVGLRQGAGPLCRPAPSPLTQPFPLTSPARSQGEMFEVKVFSFSFLFLSLPGDPSQHHHSSHALMRPQRVPRRARASILAWLMLGQGLAQPQPWLTARERPAASVWPRHPRRTARPSPRRPRARCPLQQRRRVPLRGQSLDGGARRRDRQQRLDVARAAARRDPCVLSFIDHARRTPTASSRNFSRGSARFEARGSRSGAARRAPHVRRARPDARRRALAARAQRRRRPRRPRASPRRRRRRPPRGRSRGACSCSRAERYVGLSTLKKRALRGDSGAATSRAPTPRSAATRGSARARRRRGSSTRRRASSISRSRTPPRSSSSRARARPRAARAPCDASGGAAAADVS